VSEPRIRLRRLRKRFGSRVALDGIDLEVADRRIVGLVGPDGAGKTTLLRTLAGLLEIEADEATVIGHDLRGDVTALKAAIGYVPQTFSLHRELSVIENLRFTARLHRLPEATFRSRSAALLGRTFLAPFAERAAGALSGGMKQKLAIANALLPDPALLVLDEPTAGVDVVARGEIQAILRETAARALVMMSTSYLDEAAEVDELVYLDRGRIVASGIPATLRRQVPRVVYRLWGPNARAIARAARAVPGVADARAAGGFARVEVERPVPADVPARLRALPGAPVTFLEPTEPDMESLLRFYASA
jgi:ABC-2 type transport system ATP-binding protein